MTITIAGTNFDQHQYDERGDVLYLSVGAPREPARTIATPEGHAVDYDDTGTVIGISRLQQPLGEERQDLVAGGDRRLARFVDQVGGHHAVRAADHVFEEGCGIGIGGAVGEHAPDEALAERLPVGGEPLGSAPAITAGPVPAVWTTFATPSRAISRASKSSSGSSSCMLRVGFFGIRRTP
jgi:uncharacterized protein YuzE